MRHSQCDLLLTCCTVILRFEDGRIKAQYPMDAAGAAENSQLDIIFRTEPIPKDAIAAAPGVPADVIAKLRDAFESVRDGDAACGAAMKQAHINGFVEAQDASYEVVRKAAAHK